MEAGRVRPADGVTMKLVLDALPNDVAVPYGIIVNKVSTNLMDKLQNQHDAWSKVCACLNEGRDHPTAYIHLYKEVEGLKDVDDKVHEPSVSLCHFLNMLPSVRIKPEDVQDVQSTEFDVLVEKYETLMEELRSDKAKLEAKMEKDRCELEKQIAKMNEDHEKALEEARSSGKDDLWKVLMEEILIPLVPVALVAAERALNGSRIKSLTGHPSYVG